MDNQNLNKGEQRDPRKPGDAPPPRSPFNVFNIIIAGIIISFILNFFTMNMVTQQKVQIEYNQFLELLDLGMVKQVEIDDNELLFSLNDPVDTGKVRGILKIHEPKGEANQKREDILLQHGSYYTGLVGDTKLVDRLVEKGVAFYKPITRSNPILDFMSTWVFPIIIFYLIYWFIMRAMAKRMGGAMGGGLGGMMNIGKSKAKQYDMEKSTGITFSDVAGEDEAKESLQEIVDLLHNPKKYTDIGAVQPKGALLVGPPGTGKTLLAKAVAGEAKVPFFSLTGSDFVEMFVGVGASRVRDLFAEANKHAPCIIFIDEIDAIGKSRDNQMGGNDERENTLNQLLSEMDGFDSSKGIVILAATNRPEILDKALLRPGRFDRRIVVERPDLPGREAILKVHAKKVKLGGDVNLHDIALSTSGATGADLANMVNEAALGAVRSGRDKVAQADFQEAVETVIAGKEKKDRIMNPKEKRMVAFHEVGHALTSALQTHSQPVQKITIVPRTLGSLGYTMNMPEEERYLLTKEELLAQITTLLGGRSAEEVEFNEESTGASNDIERATKLARSMVTQYGMSDAFGMMTLESAQNQYLDGRNVFTASEASSAEVDKEVTRILENCHKKARSLLEENRGKLKEIAEFLIEKETITGKQFMDLLEKRN